MSATLHLVLKKEWYHMILSGAKKEEYREMKDHWKCRLLVPFTGTPRHFRLICFHLGYTKRKMYFEWKGTEVGVGKTEWGYKGPEEVFIIKIGNQIINSLM